MTMNAAEIYRRLAVVDNWEDVNDLKNDIAAAICAHAEDKEPLRAAYEAATSMAATHPMEDARNRWASTARQYGAWLGIATEDVNGRIAYKGRKGSYVTYESARAEAKAAPFDPVYTIAAAS